MASLPMNPSLEAQTTFSSESAGPVMVRVPSGFRLQELRLWRWCATGLTGLRGLVFWLGQPAGEAGGRDEQDRRVEQGLADIAHFGEQSEKDRTACRDEPTDVVAKARTGRSEQGGE